jgi:hypothetical protein
VIHESPRLFLPIDFATEGPKREQRKCEGCGAPTKEGKPACKKCLHLMPYAAKVMAELAALPKEQDWRPRKRRCKGCPLWFLAKHPEHAFHDKACGRRFWAKEAKKRGHANPAPKPPRKPRASVPKKCRACGNEFTADPAARRCYPCKSAAHSRARKAREERRRQAPGQDARPHETWEQAS